MASSIGSQGTTISIGTQADDPGTDTFEEIGEVVSIDGSFGTNWSINEFGRLASGAVVKSKNQINYGSVTVSVGRLISDTGQEDAAAAAASTSSIPYNIKITLDDQPAGGSNATSFDLKALVTSYNTSIGDTSSEVTVEIGLEVVEAPVETPAA